MTALSAAPTHDLLDMLFVRTGLLMREAKKSTMALVFAGPTGGLYQHVAAKARFLLAAKNAIARMKESTESVVNSTAWFEEFCAELADSETFPEEDIRRVLVTIEEGQRGLEELQEALFSAMPILAKSAISPKMRASRVGVAQRLERAVVGQYTALENIRWALLEQLADIDIAAGKVSEAYSSVEDLFASLRS